MKGTGIKRRYDLGLNHEAYELSKKKMKTYHFGFSIEVKDGLIFKSSSADSEMKRNMDISSNNKK